MNHKGWTNEKVAEFFDRPLLDLLLEAQQIHRQWHRPNEIQLSTLLSIKTGGCQEDCGYCSQSAFATSGVKAAKLLNRDEVIKAASEAKAAGSTRFCMGAAWREPKDRDMPALCEMIGSVKALGLETCMTLGMLSARQAGQLASAGLDFYNHNLDTSEDHYPKVVTTRRYSERLETLDHVRVAGMAVCCGGIIGMGETRSDRVKLLATLANLPEPPQSVPINALVPVQGTRLGDKALQTDDRLDELEFVRTIAVARLIMPQSVIRLSAGRESLSESSQALCFLAGASSIFTGDRLLTTRNCGSSKDSKLFEKLGLSAAPLGQPAAPPR
ncbi:MAG TPA: biotin synthase BioB [Sphingomicrobium sp.]|jgi:biotin synthase